MPASDQMIKTLLVCAACRLELNMCVPVRRGVPDFLRCDHGQHGGVEKDSAGAVLCPRCKRSWRLGGESLMRRVEDLLSSNMQEWRRRGHVVLVCGG